MIAVKLLWLTLSTDMAIYIAPEYGKDRPLTFLRLCTNSMSESRVNSFSKTAKFMAYTLAPIVLPKPFFSVLWLLYASF